MLRPVQLTKEQRRLYNELRDLLISQLETGEIVTADQAVVKLLRLQQIVCGHLKDAEGVVHRLPSNRAEEALAVANQSSDKVVIWARFHADIDILMEAFAPWNPVQYDGRVKSEQRRDNKDRFINDPACGAFIANQAAGGTGTDGLQRASHTAIYYSNSFKAVDRWQAHGRLVRDGQRYAVNNIDLVAKGTVDTYILRILGMRQDIANSALTISRGDL